MQGHNNHNESAELENFKILRSIYKNTYDKMLEIKVMNRRSLNESKKTILIEEQKKIDAKYDKEYNEQYISNKIQISEARNTSNLNKMRKRNELIEKLHSDTLNKIKAFAKPENEKYRELLKKLILQAMVKMLEPVVLVQVRKGDVEIVKKMAKDLEHDYSKLMKDETGEEYKCTIEIDNVHLDNES
jgi:V-type H+-transporting ATPase subunit E